MSSNRPSAPQRLAFIGLGNMGKAMARNISVKANLAHPLAIYNRTAQRAVDFAATLEDPSLVEVAASVEDAVKPADIVFVSMGGDASVKELFAAILKTPGGVKGKLFIETSTILPDTSNEVAASVVAAGAEFISCPVFGAPAIAEAGGLIVVAAGPAASVDRALPYFTGVIGRAVVDLRDRAPGHALLLKITGNHFIISMVEALAEGHVWAEKSGLGTETLHQFISLMFPGPFAAYSDRMRLGDYMRDEPLFAVDNAMKDVGHAINLASSVGVDLKITKVGNQHLKELKEIGGVKSDLPGIYGAVRVESGLDFDVRKS